MLEHRANAPMSVTLVTAMGRYGFYEHEHNPNPESPMVVKVRLMLAAFSGCCFWITPRSFEDYSVFHFGIRLPNVSEKPSVPIATLGQYTRRYLIFCQAISLKLFRHDSGCMRLELSFTDSSQRRHVSQMNFSSSEISISRFSTLLVNSPSMMR